MELNDKYDNFQQRVLLTFYASFPEKKRVVRGCDNGLHWYGGGLHNMRESYLFLRELYSRYGTAELLQLRNSQRNKYRHAIDFAKRSASTNYINNSNNKQRAMWKLINRKQKPQSKFPNNLDVNAMNTFFCNIAEQTIAQITSSAPPIAYIGVTDSVFSFDLVSPTLIRSVIYDIKNSSTVDSYGLSAKFVKRNVSLFVGPLTKLVNLSLESSIFPDSLKVAKILPIYKKGDQG